MSADEREARPGGCPDGGTCHHLCGTDGPCFRVQSCGPLSGVYPDDRWPEVVAGAERARAAVAAWNEQHAIGSLVLAFPGSRDGRALHTRTCSAAWVLGGHTAVVKVEGYAGGIALSHVEPVLTDDEIAVALEVLAPGDDDRTVAEIRAAHPRSPVRLDVVPGDTGRSPSALGMVEALDAAAEPDERLREARQRFIELRRAYDALLPEVERLRAFAATAHGQEAWDDLKARHDALQRQVDAAHTAAVQVERRLFAATQDAASDVMRGALVEEALRLSRQVMEATRKHKARAALSHAATEGDDRD